MLNMRIRLLDFFKDRIKNQSNRQLVWNVIASFTLYISRYALQIIQYFYLIWALGFTYYGLLSFGTTIILYFDIVIEYGFNFPATRQVSQNRDNKELVTEIYSAITFTRLMFFVACAVAYFPLIALVSSFNEYWQMYAIFFGMLLGYALTSGWFFQGMEKFKFITYNYILSYLIYTICLVIFVHKPGDYWIAALFETSYIVLIGVLNVLIIKHTFGIKFVRPRLNAIKKQLREGWVMFFQSIIYGVYSYSGILLLGLLTSNLSSGYLYVGYYSLATTIIAAGQGAIGAITTVFFPRVTKLIQDSKERAMSYVKKYFIFILSLGIAIFVGIFFLSGLLPWFAGIVGIHKNFTQIIVILKIQSILPVLLVINNTLGYQVMLALDYKRALTTVYACAFSLCLLLAIIFVPLYYHIAMAIIIVIVETFIMISEFTFLKRRGINIFAGMQKNVMDILRNRKAVD
jgi:PST family polysaccharide transporter